MSIYKKVTVNLKKKIQNSMQKNQHQWYTVQCMKKKNIIPELNKGSVNDKSNFNLLKCAKFTILAFSSKLPV